MRGPALRVAVVYPDLLGTYGDGGNGLVLAKRASWRCVPVELLDAQSHDRLPEADIYCLGGGEDGPQAQATAALAADGRLPDAVASGSVVLAVCAGFQIVGRTFPAADGRPLTGLGLLDIETTKGAGRRAVGELTAAPLPLAGARPLPTLTGFENHGGSTTLGDGVTPLARVLSGIGNGGGDQTEGAVSGRVVGTYLHGPVLARNPALADLLIGWALGSEEPLEDLDDAPADALRAERLAAAGRRARRGAR